MVSIQYDSDYESDLIMNKFSYCKGFGVDCIDHVSAAFFFHFFVRLRLSKYITC